MAYKILIIDDDAELLKMLKKYLEIKRYEIITAENGLEGLNKITAAGYYIAGCKYAEHGRDRGMQEGAG